MLTVTRVENEYCKSIQLIGKKYTNGGAWGLWWQNGWFDILENTSGLSPLNDNGYIGLMRNPAEGFEYWIGMFFDKETDIPAGFESLDIPDTAFASFRIYGSEQAGEIYGEVPHRMCIEILKDNKTDVFSDGLRFERYNCPRYTSPDRQGNVILDYLIAIKQ